MFTSRSKSTAAGVATNKLLFKILQCTPDYNKHMPLKSFIFHVFDWKWLKVHRIKCNSAEVQYSRILISNIAFFFLSESTAIHPHCGFFMWSMRKPHGEHSSVLCLLSPAFANTLIILMKYYTTAMNDSTWLVLIILIFTWKIRTINHLATCGQYFERAATASAM